MRSSWPPGVAGARSVGTRLRWSQTDREELGGRSRCRRRPQHEPALFPVEEAVADDEAVVTDVRRLEQRPARRIDPLLEIEHRAGRAQERMRPRLARVPGHSDDLTVLVE